MKINAKKTNSASENAIQASYFFSSFANWFTYHEYRWGTFLYEVNSMQMSGQNNSDQSYHWTNRPHAGNFKNQLHIGPSTFIPNCEFPTLVEIILGMYSVFRLVLTAAGLWFYVMERMEFCSEELTSEWLVCYQDYLIRRDVAYGLEYGDSAGFRLK